MAFIMLSWMCLQSVLESSDRVSPTAEQSFIDLSQELCKVLSLLFNSILSISLWILLPISVTPMRGWGFSDGTYDSFGPRI